MYPALKAAPWHVPSPVRRPLPVPAPLDCPSLASASQKVNTPQFLIPHFSLFPSPTTPTLTPQINIQLHYNHSNLCPIPISILQPCPTTNLLLSSRTSILPLERCRALLEVSLAVLVTRSVVKSSMFLSSIFSPTAQRLYATYDSARNSVHSISLSIFCHRLNR